MGQVIATITVTNRIDQVLAERVSSAEEVRSCTLDNVFDTVQPCCLPIALSVNPGLVQGKPVETTAGIKQGGFFGMLNSVLRTLRNV